MWKAPQRVCRVALPAGASGQSVGQWSSLHIYIFTCTSVPSPDMQSTILQPEQQAL